MCVAHGQNLFRIQQCYIYLDHDVHIHAVRVADRVAALAPPADWKRNNAHTRLTPNNHRESRDRCLDIVSSCCQACRRLSRSLGTTGTNTGSTRMSRVRQSRCYNTRAHCCPYEFPPENLEIIIVTGTHAPGPKQAGLSVSAEDLLRVTAHA